MPIIEDIGQTNFVIRLDYQHEPNVQLWANSAHQHWIVPTDESVNYLSIDPNFVHTQHEYLFFHSCFSIPSSHRIENSPPAKPLLQAKKNETRIRLIHA